MPAKRKHPKAANSRSTLHGGSRHACEAGAPHPAWREAAVDQSSREGNQAVDISVSGHAHELHVVQEQGEAVSGGAKALAEGRERHAGQLVKPRLHARYALTPVAFQQLIRERAISKEDTEGGGSLHQGVGEGGGWGVRGRDVADTQHLHLRSA